MSDLIERLNSVWPCEIPAITRIERNAVIELQSLKKEAANEIERLRGEVAMLRTGDTCARTCEGTAYRIEARRLRAAIIQTLNENGHLADGENCTLIALKRAVPGWELPE